MAFATPYSAPSTSHQGKWSNKTAAPLIKNFETCTCRFCSSRLLPGQGVMLQECLHTFCRECLQFAVKMQTESMEIPCPVWYFLNCGGFLTNNEVKQLVSPTLYQEYLDRSLVVAKKKMRNAFSCKTAGCGGWCEIEPGRKTFLCPICKQISCVPCKMIHPPGWSCDANRKTEKKDKTGLSQLIIFAQRTGDTRQIEKTDLLINLAEFECSICLSDIPAGEGIILHECFHMFCKECLTRLVECNEEVQVKCPYVDSDNNEGCKYHLLPREIKALVPPHIYEKHLQRSVKLGESSSENSFHCKTPDCPGWCFYDQGVPWFRCNVCCKTSCIPCQATFHYGMTCAEYKSRLHQNQSEQQSTATLEQMIARGECMRCPQCQIPVQKATGCDWLQCPACKTEICWATRGPRWGPRGKGDKSGGCNCSFMRRCHPQCQNCH